MKSCGVKLISVKGYKRRTPGRAASGYGLQLTDLQGVIIIPLGRNRERLGRDICLMMEGLHDPAVLRFFGLPPEESAISDRMGWVTTAASPGSDWLRGVVCGDVVSKIKTLCEDLERRLIKREARDSHFLSEQLRAQGYRLRVVGRTDYGIAFQVAFWSDSEGTNRRGCGSFLYHFHSHAVEMKRKYDGTDRGFIMDFTQSFMDQANSKENPFGWLSEIGRDFFMAQEIGMKLAA